MSARQKKLVTDSLQEAQGEDVAIDDILKREECPPSLLDCELYQTLPLSPNMECTRHQEDEKAVTPAIKALIEHFIWKMIQFRMQRWEARELIDAIEDNLVSQVSFTQMKDCVNFITLSKTPPLQQHVLR